MKVMRKTIDAKMAKTLCDGCIYQRKLDMRCARCFVQILGDWTATAKVVSDDDSPRAKALRAADALAEENRRRRHE